MPVINFTHSNTIYVMTKTKINRSINSRSALRENNYQQRHWDTLNFRTQYMCQTYKDQFYVAQLNIHSITNNQFNITSHKDKFSYIVKIYTIWIFAFAPVEFPTRDVYC